MRRATASAIALFAVLMLHGCSDEPGAPSDSNSAPALPSASTMRMDMDFPGTSGFLVATLGETGGRPASPSHENWITAYSRGSYIVLSVYDHLEEPAAAFAAAIHSHPQHMEDGSWLWTYIFVDAATGDEYSVFLYASRGEESIAWRMEVSSSDTEMPLDHFIWFDGESALNARSGFWQFYQPIDATQGVPTARVDWTRTFSDRRLTILVNGDVENFGDSLDLHESTPESSIEYVDASAQAVENITWYANGSGHITAPDYNGGSTACWDANQVDVSCD